MRYGEVFDYRNAEEAKQYIGKKGVFSDSLRDICKRPAEKRFGFLAIVTVKDAYLPFIRKDKDGKGDVPYQFFRPILEDEKS